MLKKQFTQLLHGHVSVGRGVVLSTYENVNVNENLPGGDNVPWKELGSKENSIAYSSLDKKYEGVSRMNIDFFCKRHTAFLYCKNFPKNKN